MTPEDLPPEGSTPSQERQGFATLPRKLALASASLLLTLVALELLVRLYLSLSPALRPRMLEETIPAGAAKVDTLLGWAPTPGFSMQVEKPDAAGNLYEVDFRLGHEGFRSWPEEPSDRPRILVLGDSFTFAADVSNNATYYSVAGEILDAEVYAHGCGGYSTLQAFLVLQTHFDEIHPDLVLWQFTANDFIGNLYDLEIQSRANNNRMRRPYLQPDGTIEYQVPTNMPAIRYFAQNYSKLLLIVLSKLDSRLANSNWLETRIERDGVSHPGLKSSAEVTEQTFRLVKEVTGQVPVVVFCVDQHQPYLTVLSELLDREGIDWIPDVGQTVEAHEADGEVIRAWDKGHWNPRGHQIAGEHIAEYLAREYRLMFAEPAASPQ